MAECTSKCEYQLRCRMEGVGVAIWVSLAETGNILLLWGRVGRDRYACIKDRILTYMDKMLRKWHFIMQTVMR